MKIKGFPKSPIWFLENSRETLLLLIHVPISIFVFKFWLFLQKQSPRASNFVKKETLTQLFSCEFYKISRNNFSYRTPPVAASVSPNFNSSNLMAKLLSYNTVRKLFENKKKKKNLKLRNTRETFSERRGLTGSQFLEGGCWERGVWLFT